MQINTPIESNIKNSEHIDNINNYKIDNPDDIQSIIQQIDDSELAIVIDDSFASNIAMQINSSSVISNDISNDFEDENEMSIILETIREREEQEKKDEEFARKLSEEFNNHGNINASEINNGASGIDYDNDYDNDISFINEDRNIRNIQDEEYEESLKCDEEKEKEKCKEKDIDKINVNHQSYINDINLKNENYSISDSKSIEKEIKKLSIKEMRDARLAFFNKK
jgi:hypothetical protein